MPHRRLASLVPVLAVSMAACETPTEHLGRSWTLNVDSLVSLAPGDSAAVTASNGVRTSAVSLAITAEAREITETGVVDRASLERGMIRAEGPGTTALVAVIHGAAVSIPLHVEVRPHTPGAAFLRSWSLEGGVLTLQGEWLNEIVSAEAGGKAAEVLERSYIRAAIDVRSGIGSTCLTGSDLAVITVMLDVAPGRLVVGVPIAGEICASLLTDLRLSVGESVALDEGESRRVVLLHGTDSVAVVLALVSESRTIPGLPVLSLDGLAAGVLEATGAGTARVRAVVPRTEHLGLEFDVRASAIGPEDMARIDAWRLLDDGQLVLGGRRLNLVRDVRVGEYVATVREQSYATAVIDIGGAVRLACDAGEAALHVGNATWAVAAPELIRGIRLGVGEAADVSPHEALCLRFTESGTYLWALTDTAWISESRVGVVDQPGGPRRIQLGIGQTAGAMPNRASGRSPPTSQLHARHASTDGRHSMHQLEFLSDSVVITRSLRDYTQQVRSRIVRTWSDYLALAIPEESMGQWTAQLSAVVDSAFSDYLTYSDPMIASALGRERPYSDEGRGLLVIVAIPGQNGLGGFAWYSHAELLLGSNVAAAPLFNILTHEFAHVWHFRRAFDGQRTGSWNHWHVEGFATFIGHEASRIRGGYGARDNVEWWLDDMGSLGNPYLVEIMAESGAVGFGYAPSSSFARHVVNRLWLEQGLSRPAAFGAVATAFMSGWYGCYLPGVCANEGLGRLVERHGYTPAGLLLDWALARIADDDPLLPFPYHDPGFLRAGGRPELGFWGGPHTILDSASPSRGEAVVPATGVYVLRVEASAGQPVYVQGETHLMAMKVLRIR
jgi:hypothetical protein